ncbi:MAG TPA: class I SAM-dependent methyltransferase [Actinomycetes bacterium]|nr:class I SAM-dependent methyltransferase [Actinomycetes bacterium]
MVEPNQDTHWAQWHRDYDDPRSALAARLEIVVARTRQAIDDAPGARVRLISLCAGQGRDVVAALVGNSRRQAVSGRLVEADAYNCEVARASLVDAGLSAIEVVQGDAALLDAYQDVVPADVLLLCGIFGNISDEDVHYTIQNTSRLCAPGACVIWTRHRAAADLTPQIRDWFAQAGYGEVAFDAPADHWIGVGTHRLQTDPLPFDSGVRLFSFRE